MTPKEMMRVIVGAEHEARMRRRRQEFRLRIWRNQHEDTSGGE